MREGAAAGRDGILDEGVYVDFKVWIGDNVKVQNYALAHYGVNIGDGVFIGPNAFLGNDRCLRAAAVDCGMRFARSEV